MKRAFPAGVCVAIVLLMAVVCLLGRAGSALAADDPLERPNFLIVVTDDQRPDTIRALGNDIIHTPTLDGLVARGATFTRAIVPYPICVPSRAEILTGCDTFRNGFRDPPAGRISPDCVLWGDAMRQAGYRSWYVGKWMNDGKPITRGYEETLGLFASGGGRWAVEGVDWHGRPITGYTGWVFQADDGTKFPERGVGLTPNISKRFADAAIAFIRRKPEAPFFLHVNFTAPHDPLLMPPGYEKMYNPDDIPLPPNFAPRHPFDHGNLEGRDELLLPWPRTSKDVREDLAVYYAVISHMDEHLGRILEALESTGQAKNTVVIFTSDHGLAMGSHGLRGKQNMYEHTIGVPFIVAGPGIPQGVRFDAQCYVRDMYPTTCDLAGIEVPSTVRAKSLVPVLRGEATAVHPCLFGYYRDFQRMIRIDRWKLIHYAHINKYQLFDLADDPYELNDLSNDSTCRETMADLQARLKAWQKEVGDSLLTE